MTLSETYQSRKKLLADNLNNMGVLDVSETDGLTTLINAVLDIEPSIGGLDLDTMVSIASSSNEVTVGESIVLTSKLTASYDDETLVDVDLTGVLQNATIKYYNGNTLIGTGVTGVDGVCTCTYVADTVGTMSIKAVFDGTDNFKDCQSSNVSVVVNAPLFVDITLTEQDSKSVLSFDDGDSAVLVAQLVDGNDEPVSVSGVSVSLYKDNVLWDTISTDGTGKVSKTYNSAGVGDIVFKAEVSGSSGLVSKTYEVQDTFKYYPNEISKTSTSTGSYIFTPLFDGFSFVSDSFVAEFDIKVNGNGVGVSISSTANNNKFLWLANQIQSQISKKVLYYRDSANAEKGEYYNTMDTNTYYHIKMEYNNSELKVYDETGLLSTITGLNHYNGDTRSIYFGEWVRNHTVTIKNVLIKPL